MVEAHRLAPVGEREVGVGLLGALERLGGLVELEAVQGLDAFEEGGLRRRLAGGGERDRAELLRVGRGAGEGERHDRQPSVMPHGRFLHPGDVVPSQSTAV